MNIYVAIFSIVVGILILCLLVLLLRPVSGKGRISIVPSPKEVTERIQYLDELSKQIISELNIQYPNKLSTETFFEACVLQMMIIERVGFMEPYYEFNDHPLNVLKSKTYSVDLVDSLDSTRLLIVTEDLFSIKIPEYDWEDIFTFEEFLHYVETAISNQKQNSETADNATN